jgi:pimeloyl-ACP methyl ester carboxylesterase
VVLIMGLAAQLVAWGDTLVDGLAAAGYRVVLFDNRDIGLSEKLYGEKRPWLRWQLLKSVVGLPVNSVYKLSDMAADTLGLMDHLEIESAHIVGASMGGMIAQTLVSEYPQRARSLISIMSTSSAKHLPVDRGLLRELGPFRSSRISRAERMEQSVTLLRKIGSPVYPDDEFNREMVTLSFNRCFYQPGPERQMTAVGASGDRVELLKGLRLPTLVIHGDKDPLVPLEHGRHTAELVPGSQFKIIGGMGHNLEPRVAELVVAEMVPFIDATEAARGQRQPSKRVASGAGVVS